VGGRGGGGAWVVALGQVVKLTPPQSFPVPSFPLGWTLVKTKESKGQWDFFAAASSPQSDDALESLYIRGRPLLCAEAGGACAFY
jgi:hypothetical protein